MPNLTIHLDDDTHRLAKVYAAHHETSLSQLFRNHIRNLAGSAEDQRKNLILGKYCSGEITKSDAMTGLSIRCVEDLYATLINAGFDLPRQKRKDALESGSAATKFVKKHTHE